MAGLAIPSLASAQTNSGHLISLLTNQPPERLAISERAAANGYVPTNTVAFCRYALDSMLRQVNFLNEKWDLGIASPVTSDQVTSFRAIPTIYGIEGWITISNAHHFGFKGGAWTDYHDNRFWWYGLQNDLPRLEKLARVPNRLTKNQALQLALDAVTRAGVKPQRQFSAEVNQYAFDPEDGKEFPIPPYKVEWRKRDQESGSLGVEISGLTEHVVAFSSLVAKPMPLPSNYFVMLGISPQKTNWGKRFGYDPHDTDEFQLSARQFAVEQLNRLISLWGLGGRTLTTKDITSFRAHPDTNGVSIDWVATDRFYLQISQGRITLFKDNANSIEAITDSAKAMSSALAKSNSLDTASATRLAREALHKLGVDEKYLKLLEPPRVEQYDLPMPGQEDSDLRYTLPIYNVMWSHLVEDQSKFGKDAVGIQVSGITKKVVVYGNNSTLAPHLAVSGNYPALLGLTNSPTKSH
jgi:hypothetical protein